MIDDDSAYRTVTVAAGERDVYRVDDGETLERLLIDQRAGCASMTIDARGVRDWAIRHVGFLGDGDHSGHGGFQITAWVPSGGRGVIENVFVDQLYDGDTTTEIGGVFVGRRHAGRLDVRHTYLRGHGNNAVYGSDPGTSAPDQPTGRDGRVTFQNCYHRDNTVSQFRVGTPGSTVRNCVGIVDDPDLGRGPYPDTSSRRARAVWGRHHPGQRVENSAFYVNPDDPEAHAAFMATHIADRSNGDGAALEVVDCDINADAEIVTACSDPDGPGLVEHCADLATTDVILENLGTDPSVDVIRGGVPTSAEMAARGDREAPPELPD